jgi:hypothetical protein
LHPGAGFLPNPDLIPGGHGYHLIVKGEISVHPPVLPVFKLPGPSGSLRVIAAGMDNLVKLSFLIQGTVLQKLGMCLSQVKGCERSLSLAPDHFDLLQGLHENFLLYHDTYLRSLAGRKLW